MDPSYIIPGRAVVEELQPLADVMNETPSLVDNAYVHFNVNTAQVAFTIAIQGEYFQHLGAGMSHDAFRIVAKMPEEVRDQIIRSLTVVAVQAYKDGRKSGEEGIKRALWALAAPQVVKNELPLD